MTFVSDLLYAGSASDFDITNVCGIMDLLEHNDHVVADKGIEIKILFDKSCVQADHPPILSGVSVMSNE